MDITNPQVREYLASVMPERTPELQQLHAYAQKHNVPIIKHEMEQFLKCMIAIHRPLRILEIGTAIGFSAIVMLQEGGQAVSLTTLEKSKKMIELARQNFEAFKVEDQVDLIEGDAVVSLQSLKEPYDFIFMDAAKGQYMTYYNDVMRLLKPKGILIADNILQDGLIAKSRFAIPRRQRTIHSRMRAFIQLLSTHEALVTSVLPIADGATISIRKDLST